MAVQKPQKTLVVNEQEIYPLTCADQIVLEDGTRMRADGKAKDALALGGIDAAAYEQLVSYGTTDYGKVLSCSEDGLVWIDAVHSPNAEGVAF